MKTTIGLSIAILVLGGLIWFAQPDGNNNVASVKTVDEGTLTVEGAKDYDFGAIRMAAGNVAHVFRVKNTSNEPVAINKMYTSCMCTTAALSVGGKQFGPYGMPGHSAIPRIDQVINSGEEATVEVVFDPGRRTVLPALVELSGRLP